MDDKTTKDQTTAQQTKATAEETTTTPRQWTLEELNEAERIVSEQAEEIHKENPKSWIGALVLSLEAAVTTIQKLRARFTLTRKDAVSLIAAAGERKAMREIERARQEQQGEKREDLN